MNRGLGKRIDDLYRWNSPLLCTLTNVLNTTVDLGSSYGFPSVRGFCISGLTLGPTPSRNAKGSVVWMVVRTGLSTVSTYTVQNATIPDVRPRGPIVSQNWWRNCATSRTGGRTEINSLKESRIFTLQPILFRRAVFQRMLSKRRHIRCSLELPRTPRHVTHCSFDPL